MLLKWEDLSMERCSMMNFVTGKFVKTKDAYNQEFMLAYGRNRFNNYKLCIVLMDGTFKDYYCNNEKECDETAFTIIKYLYTSRDTIMRFFEPEPESAKNESEEE
jgi:hypothetical protein